MAQAVLQPKAEKLVFVLVSNRSYLPFDPQDITNLAALLPLGVEVLRLHSDGTLEAIWNSQKNAQKQDVLVLAWPDAQDPQAFLPNNNLGSLFIPLQTLQTSPTWQATKTDLPNNVWENGVHLAAQSASLAFHPEAGDVAWRQLTRNSFAAHLLTPATAFLALETESQKRLLMKKQWEALHANKALDLGEEPTPMSEPEWWWILFLAAFWLWYVRRK